MVPHFFPKSMPYPGAQHVPREEHLAAPMVWVLEVHHHVVLSWRCSLGCLGSVRAQENSQILVRRKSHPLYISMPPSRPIGTIRQQGSRRVSIDRPILTSEIQPQKQQQQNACQMVNWLESNHA